MFFRKKKDDDSQEKAEQLREDFLKNALEIAAEKGQILDYSNDSVKIVDTLLHDDFIELQKEKITEGVYGISMFFGAYISKVIEKQIGAGVWNFNGKEDGKVRFNYSVNGLSYDVVQWCYEVLHNGHKGNLIKEYQDLLLHEKTRKIFDPKDANNKMKKDDIVYDQEKLLTFIMNQATSYIWKRGNFVPFGAGIHFDGDIQPIMYYEDSKLREGSGNKIIDGLKAGINQMPDTFRAAAIAFEASAKSPEDESVIDVIVVVIDHVFAESIIQQIPYEPKRGGAVLWDKAYSVKGGMHIFNKK